MAAAVVLAAAGAVPTAMSEPGGIYTGMGNCPITARAMQDPTHLQVGCLISVTSGGSFRIGTTNVPITSPITLQFGVYWPSSAPVVEFPDGTTANVYTVVPPTRAKTLSARPIEVPIPGLPSIIPGVTSIFAQVELAGPITSFVPLAIGQDHPVFRLPIKLRLINGILGIDCFVGSDRNPLVLQPQIVDPGVIEVLPDPNGFQATVVSFSGATLSDNEFGAVGATGCGWFGSLNGLVNKAFGLDNAGPGQNEVVFRPTSTSLALDPSISDLAAALAAS
ncbi:hypothetical protein [Allorhizocola rhizosphaerae]|uniref:hypothetical protein n=1 Tax=Allorhizocola rhizosphaerae TaxID=1872709 RepID=UPI000E3BB2A9|nr:hypothetical protein [Allorhizocola rhizosphaerae]